MSGAELVIDGQPRGKFDPLFDQVRQHIVSTRDPSISRIQRVFKLGYNRTCSMVEALEGDLVCPRDSNGWRSMLEGETCRDTFGSFEVTSVKQRSPQ